MKISHKVMGIGILIIIGVIFFSGISAGDNLTLTTSRIKDIARLQGVRSNQLNGMGLVMGLNGTGDTSNAATEIVINILAKWGINVVLNDLRTRNVAAVMVTATLPPYFHQGDTLDAQVASIGDARSLQGGVLLQSPLTGADGKVYAVAQGPVYVGGFTAGDKGASVHQNVTNAGIVTQGVIVERDVPMELESNGVLRWALNNPDFTTAFRLAQTINDNIARGAAKAVDMGLIEVQIPRENLSDPIAFIAEIESLPVTPDGVAKVVINERNGTVVIGENVKIAPVAVTHRNITVKVNSVAQASQPGTLSRGNTVITKNSSVNVDEQHGQMIILPDGTTIGSIVRSLNAVGSTPQDIIAIIVAIKEAGALYGVLEFQ